MFAIEDILLLAGRYARARRIATSTLARIATGSSTWLDRCASGRVTIRSAVSVVQWLSDHWPEGLEWPSDIARPQPTPGSPQAAYPFPPPPAGNSLGAVEAAKPRTQSAVRRSGRTSARATAGSPHPTGRGESAGTSLVAGR